jgi:cysteine dioxygenase
MIAAVSDLADVLRRLRTGEGPTSEVVQWLRASCAAVETLQAPRIHDVRRDYTRTLLYKSDLFELLAIHWQPNCRSVIHDHGGALCWLAIAQGSMRVENYLRTDSGSTQGYAAMKMEGREELRPGDIDYRQDDLHLHRCIGPESGGAISLHVYAHPIERFRGFDERTNSCFEITSTYDAILSR